MVDLYLVKLIDDLCAEHSSRFQGCSLNTNRKKKIGISRVLGFQQMFIYKKMNQVSYTTYQEVMSVKGQKSEERLVIFKTMIKESDIRRKLEARARYPHLERNLAEMADGLRGEMARDQFRELGVESQIILSSVSSNSKDFKLDLSEKSLKSCLRI